MVQNNVTWYKIIPRGTKMQGGILNVETMMLMLKQQMLVQMNEIKSRCFPGEAFVNMQVGGGRLTLA